MKFKSQVYSAVSGSVGGVTYAHNAGGMYARARGMPTNPQSVYQNATRGALTTLVSAWSDVLDQAQRDAWRIYAANVPMVDALGDSRARSGQQHYVRSNVPRLQAGLERVDDAPTTFNLGDFTPPPEFEFQDVPRVAGTIDDNDAWANEDGAAMLIYGSRPQSMGREFFKGPYRFAGAVEGDSDTAPTSISLAPYPFPLEVGQKAFAYVRVTRADGRLSGIVRLSGPVV